jgi:NIMA-interacting peptidyl-prolyl cis-trans isomerase 1
MSSSSLPPGWTTHESTSRPGNFYYVHENGTKQWEYPNVVKQTTTSAAPEQVRVLHILRKHSGSRRPSSWRVENITISKAEAIDQIQQWRIALQKCSDASALQQMFEDIASKESDCSSAHKHGDLGFFGRGAMQKSFEDASFSLAVGQMSDIVDSDSGIHIILRIA